MKKILIIEDDVYIREQLVEILKAKNYDAFSASDGVEGIDKAKEFLPDIIICDILMPRLNGYQVIKELRSDPKTSPIPFIFLTAVGSKDDIRQGMDLGAEDYLTKPFSMNDLLSSIKTQLEKKENVEKRIQQQLDELRSNIIQSLPHELQTPLTSIYGFADLLSQSCQDMDIDRIKSIATTIRDCSQRLMELFHKYLDYSRILTITTDAEKLAEIRNETYSNPSEIIASVSKEKAENYERHDDLHLNLQNSTVYITDENLMKIIFELADNAFKFSEEGTKVYVESYTEEDYYIIKITNKGRKITSSQIKNIGAFMQFDRDTYEQQGSGFGLIIVKRLLEIHRGTFSIDTETEDKNIFIVKLRISDHP